MYALGIDFGTSGARTVVLGSADKVVAQAAEPYSGYPDSAENVWVQALWQLIEAIAPQIRSQVTRIAINGTSATMLLCDRQGNLLSGVLMYNDASARAALPEIAAIAPADNPACSATSTLTKALWLYQKSKPEATASDNGIYIAHQADWLAQRLHGQTPVTDYHNALKLGYDVAARRYPDWLMRSPLADWLPAVVEPGSAIATICPQIAERWGFPKNCQICAGTTDSIAAFLASGAHTIAEAVTSLGSTLVLKLLSPHPVSSQKFGIYSHRIGDLWLVGGASNTGGAVLKEFFDANQLAALSAQIDLSQPCELDYYPLNAPGERFPINDPDYAPRLTPRPQQDKDFLYGLLDAIARIEADGYRKLNGLGAPAVERVYTAGGGAQNSIWQALRQQKLGIPVTAALHTEAAYGTARLARDGLAAFKS